MSSKGVAIVTGCAQGIGRGIALRLASDGFDVTLNDIPSNESSLKELAQQIEKDSQRKTFVFTGDISKESDVENLVQKTVSELGGLDVMVANAGIHYISPLVELNESNWDRVFSVNVKGTMFCYKHAAKQMIKQGRGGRIIGASSMAGKQGAPQMGAYAATKFAIRGLTQSAACELGPHGITVNGYAPGAIDTPFLGDFAKYYTSQSGAPLESFNKMHAERVPMKRLGTPADVAALVSFLASKDSSFITGQTIITDGGGMFD